MGTDVTSLSSKLLIGYFVFLIVTIVLIFLAWKIAKKIHTKDLDKQKWLWVIKWIVFSYFIGCLIFRTGSTYFASNFEPYTDQAFIWTNIFSPFMLLENFASFFSMIVLALLDDAIGEGTSLFINVYFPGLILSFLALYSLWIVFQERKIIFLRLGIAAYVISLFLLNPLSAENQRSFEVQALDVSKILEKKQTTIFYGLTKYFNQNDGRLFRYEVEFKGGEFFIENNTGSVFHLNPDSLNKNFDQLGFNELVSHASKASPNSEIATLNKPETAVVWPKDFKCEKKEHKEEIETMQGVMETTTFYNENECSQLFYKNKLIIEEDYFQVSDLAFSEDGNWMLVVTYHGVYDPETVYLVQLTD